MNVLSIDIDFLFTDMSIIQKYMDVDLKPYQSWKVIEWKSGIKNFEPCRESYNFLSALLIKVLKKDTVISRIKEHDEIIKVFEKESVKKANVFNVDYHHDVSYGNTDDELNIENWVLFGKKKGMIDKYNWITQVDAKPCQHSVMKFNSSDWRDIDLDKIPKMDLIVLCTSHHFTPRKYWGLAKKLEKNLFRIKKMLNENPEHFKLVDTNVLDSVEYTEYPDFFFGEPNKSDFLYEYKGTFVDIYIDEFNSIPYMSMLNTGKASNVFFIKEVVDHVLKTFDKVGFIYNKNIRNSKYIERLIKNYDTIMNIEYSNKKEIIVRCK